MTLLIITSNGVATGETWGVGLPLPILDGISNGICAKPLKNFFGGRIGCFEQNL